MLLLTTSSPQAQSSQFVQLAQGTDKRFTSIISKAIRAKKKRDFNFILSIQQLCKIHVQIDFTEDEDVHMKSAAVGADLIIKSPSLETCSPQVQVGDTGGIWAFQQLHQNNEGRRLQAATTIMNEAPMKVDLFLPRQDVPRPRKVFDYGQLATASDGLSQPTPVFILEQVAPAHSGHPLKSKLGVAARNAHLSRTTWKLPTNDQINLASEAARRKLGPMLSRGLCRAYRRSSEMSCVRAASMEHSASQLSFPIWLWL